MVVIELVKEFNDCEMAFDIELDLGRPYKSKRLSSWSFSNPIACESVIDGRACASCHMALKT